MWRLNQCLRPLARQSSVTSGFAGIKTSVAAQTRSVAARLAPFRAYSAGSYSPEDYEANIKETSVERPGMSLSGKPLHIGITKDAANKLKSLSDHDNIPDLALKIHVESGGCHGFQYIFDLKRESDASEKDSVFRRDNAAVIIDHNSLQILRGSLVDYTTELIGSQFKITSPHTSSSCGCGTSFSIDPSDE